MSSINIPTRMNITIASANEAIEYWLNNAVLKEQVKIKKVTFDSNDHFTVEFDRVPDVPPTV